MLDAYQGIRFGGLVAHLADLPYVMARGVEGEGVPFVDDHNYALVPQLFDLTRVLILLKRDMSTVSASTLQSRLIKGEGWLT